MGPNHRGTPSPGGPDHTKGISFAAGDTSVNGARSNAETRKPEIVQLRDEIAELKRTLRAQKHQAARDRKEMEETVGVLANQIQFLALRNQELDVENRRLRDRQARD